MQRRKIKKMEVYADAQDQKKAANRIVPLLTELIWMRKPNLYTTHSKGYMTINK